MTGAIIPDDWDGVTYRDVCVQWPDSEGWMSLLGGSLTRFTNETLWDAETGNVDDAVAAAYEIQERNADYSECGVDEEMVYSIILKSNETKADNDFSPLLTVPFVSETAGNGVLCHYQCQFYRVTNGWVDWRIRLQTGEILKTGSIYAAGGHVIGISGALTTDGSVPAGNNVAYLEWKTDGVAHCPAGSQPGRYMASLVVRPSQIVT